MSKHNKKRAVFLDRDGVINHVVYHPCVEKPSSPWRLEEFRFIEGISPPLNEMKKRGFLLFIFSNQPDIARGNIKPGTIEDINKIIMETLPIDDIAICPHDYYHNCTCRKPKPGLIIDLAKKWDVDVQQSFVIGDSSKDIQAGNTAGCTSILIETSYNSDVETEYKAKDLMSTLAIIEKRE